MSDKSNGSLELTGGERHLVARLRAGETQEERASTLGVSLWAYRRIEKGVAAHVSERAIVGRLQPHETLMIRRIRAGMTRRKLAKKLKISEFWLYKMERGEAPLDRLSDYWSAR